MSKLKERLSHLQISFNKEIVRFAAISVVVTVGFLVAILMTKIYYLAIAYLIFMLIFSYFYFSRYKSMENKQKQDDLIEFVNLFTFFRIYLKNGFGVYTSLKEISSFANQSLKEKLEKLIQEIDDDKTIAPFVNFAHHFEELIVEEMMISIYQMIDDGENSDYLVQFELIFDKFSDLLYEKYLRAKNSKLATLSNAPLIGASFLVIVLTIGVISILGEVINGI